MGWKIVNIDCIVFAQRPKLLPHRQAIRQRLADILGIEAERVGLQAKTGEGIGAIGREEAIAAQCVALLEATRNEARYRCSADTDGPLHPYPLIHYPLDHCIMLRVYNTLTRTKEPFEPVRPGKVGIYLCGPTVYKPSHIGHMVGPVIFDAIKRYLTYSGYKVTLGGEHHRRGRQADRRVEPAAACPWPQLAAEMTADYMNNIAALGVDVIDHFPRCTETMDEIIEFTKTLVEKGFAYEAQGDVYFEVAKCPDYGKLSHRGVEAMQGEGGGMAERKRSSADFALWKSAKPGEPSWPSPWGPGRPGWHIECSAMSRKLLGETFDIHGGGLDLMFPHHENEIAQSECCHGKPMAKYWMHNGLMQASSEVGKVGGRNTRPAEGDLAAQEVGKISKSKGSAPFREMLKQFSGETIRFFVLSTQYRRPDRLQRGADPRGRDGHGHVLPLFQAVRADHRREFLLTWPRRHTRRQRRFRPPAASRCLQTVAEHRNRFLEAMDDDFNTGGGIGACSTWSGA